MYDSQYVILLFLLTAAGAEWFHKNESDARVFFFISTFHKLNTRYTYSEAREFCRTLGGDIASVLSKEEEDIFLWRLHKHIDGYFIGLKVHYTAGDSTPGFSWVDGSPYNYSNWDTSENFDNDNLCTAYVYNDTSETWKWKTEHCSRANFCICKRMFGTMVPITTASLERTTLTLQEPTTLPLSDKTEGAGVTNVSAISLYATPSGMSDMDMWIGIGAGLGISVVVVIIIIVALVVVLRRKCSDDKNDKVNNHDEIEPTIYDNNPIAITNIQLNNNGFRNNAHVNAQIFYQTNGQNNQDIITNKNENDKVYTDNSTKDNSKTPTQDELKEMYAQVNKPDTNINGNMQMLGNVTCDITKSDNHSRDVTDKPSTEELEDMYAQVNKPIAAVKPSMSGIKPGYDNHGSNGGTIVPGQHAITSLGLSDEPDGEVEFSDNLIYSS